MANPIQPIRRPPGVIIRPDPDPEVDRYTKIIIGSSAWGPILEIVARRCGVVTARELAELHFALANGYARGYVRGWRAARAERSDIMPTEPPPDPTQ